MRGRERPFQGGPGILGGADRTRIRQDGTPDRAFGALHISMNFIRIFLWYIPFYAVQRFRPVFTCILLKLALIRSLLHILSISKTNIPIESIGAMFECSFIIRDIATDKSTQKTLPESEAFLMFGSIR